MKTFAISVNWTMTSRVAVEANDEEEAVRLANKALFSSNCPLPKKNTYYLDDSFDVDSESVEETDRVTDASICEIVVHNDGTWSSDN